MMKKLWMKVSALCLLAGGACSAWVAEAQPSPVLRSEQNATGLSSETVSPFAPGTLVKDRLEAPAAVGSAGASASQVGSAVASASIVGSAETGRIETEGRFSHSVPPAIPHDAVRTLAGRAAKSSACDTIYLTTISLDEFPISMIFVGSGYGHIDWGDGSTSTYEAVEEAESYEWQTCRHNYSSERSRRIMIYTTEPGTRIMGLSMWYYTEYKNLRTGLISDMDLIRCPNMTWLNVQRQFLNHLDVSRNAALVRFDCQYNELSYLDVSGCPSLRYLICDTNNLEMLYMAGTDSLRGLTCRANSLTALDVSGRAFLQVLEANDNALETLSADSCPALEQLKCQRNVLRELRLKGCAALDTLYCFGNVLTALDLGDCGSLRVLAASDNALTALDVSKQTALTVLEVYGNALTRLDVSACPALEILDCFDNKLTSLDVRRNEALRYLRCSFNKLSQLTLGAKPHLAWLNVIYNELKTLDVSGFTALQYLYGHYNKLGKASAAGCTDLRLLSLSYNQMRTLDVSGCTALDTLYCSDNQLTKLDLKDCGRLQRVGCDNNRLKSLDLSRCGRLFSLWCRENELTALKLPAMDSGYVVAYDNALSLSTVAELIDGLRRGSYVGYHFSTQVKPVSVQQGSVLNLTGEMQMNGRTTEYGVFDEDGYTLSSDLYTASADGETGRFRFQRTGNYYIGLANAGVNDNSRMVLDSAGTDWIQWYKEWSYPIYVYYQVKVTSPRPDEPDEPDDPSDPDDPNQPGGPTANEDLTADEAASAPWAYVQGRTIYLRSDVPGGVGLGEVEAFTAVGQRVYRGYDRAFTVPTAGIYVLRAADGRRCKVMVR